MIRIELSARFQQDVAGLDAPQRAAVFDAILGLPKALGRPHAHAGIGLRKVHPSGIWEVRVGLGLRLVLAWQGKTVAFVRAGTHEDIRRYLRSL